MKFAGKSGDAAMSVTARIRQRSIFKKKLNRDDILQLTGLAYGVSDENFVLCRGEKADHTLIYDETKLARGLDLWLEDTDIPTTAKQVDMLKIRNDVLVAGIYGVTKPEMEHMLKGFNVLARKKPEYVKALLDAME